MKEELLLILKGALVGIANIIPGVSGGTLAITLGIYEKLINTITNIFKNFKENIKFLIPIGIGVVVGILLMSKLLVHAFDLYPFETNIFFVGLIFGGVPLLVRKAKPENKNIPGILIFLTVLILFILFSYAKTTDNLVSFDNMNSISYIMLFIIGFIGAATMIIPGISGSFVLMILGYYRPLLDVINQLTNFQTLSTSELLKVIFILGVFGIGMLVGIVFIAKLVEYLFKKYEIKTYYAIIGFVIGSVFLILKPFIGTSLTIINLLVSLILGIIGFMIAYKLGGE